MATFTKRLKDVIKEEGPNIGLNLYPIFDEEHRKVLNQKIIDQYWNREIGQESVSMWRLAMSRKMNLIMPLYNQHYELSAIKLEALSTVDSTMTGTNTGASESTGTGTNDSTSNASSRAVASDTPQTALQDNADYATSMQDNISESKAGSESLQTEKSKQDASTENRATGYQGHQPLLILQARQTLINIDEMIVLDLEELFMQVFTNGDSFTQNRSFNYGYYW